MTLYDKILGQYAVKAVCDNCGSLNILKVPKTISIKEFLRSIDCKCQNCGVRITKVIREDGKEVRRDGIW